MSEAKDEDPGRDALRDCFGELCERMDGEDLRRHLFSARLLTDQQNSEARDFQVKPTKNEIILGAILQRSEDDIMRFCKLLFEKNQPYCGKLLMNALNKRHVDVSELRKINGDIAAPVPAHRAAQYTYHFQQLTTPFASLVMSVKQVVSKHPELASLAITLLKNPKHKDEDVKKAIADIQLCVKEGRKEDIFIQLQPFLVDHIDLHLLESLIELSCEDTVAKQYAEEQKIDLRHKLDAYKKEVKKACESTLEDCGRTTIDGRPQNGLSVGMQTSSPPNDVTIQKILALKTYLVKDIGVEEARFDGFSCSDVTLFFSVDIKRLPFIIHWCFIHRRDLMDMFHVSLVFVPGHFVYSMAADQEYPFPEITSHSECQFLQVKDLKEEMLHQFEELKKSELFSEAEDRGMRLQDEVISLKLKLKEAEMKSLRAEEEKQKIVERFMGLQKEKTKLEDQLSQKEEMFLGRVESIQEVLEKVSGPQAKILARLESLSQKRDGDMKSSDFESLAALKSQLYEISSDLNEKMEKYKALIDDFMLQFNELGENFTTKFGEQVQKMLREMEEPFQIEIPVQSSNMVIGTRGQNLRRIERKTGVKKMKVVPTSKEGTAYVTLFGDPSACERAKVEVRILLASHVNMSKKDIIFLTRFSGKQMLSFRSLRAHEDVLVTKHYRLEAVGEKVMSEELRSMEVLSRNFSEVITEMLKSTAIPQVVIEARFGRLFWKTNHALTRDDLERKYPLERLEKDGLVHVEDILGSSYWTFQTVCKSQESKEEIAKLMSPENLGLVSIGEMETIRISFVHIPDEPDKEYVLYGLNARMCENGKFELVHITPRMKKEILFDCLPLEGNLDVRMALSTGPVCSEECSIKLTKLASEMTEGMNVKDGSLYLHKSYQECRIFHVRRSKKKLYLMHHEDHQYILLDSNVEDCNVGRQNLDDDATQYPLKDHHREIELWNCQWLADFALLEGKDWKDFFISSGCDVSQISVIPKPVKPETIVEELGPFVRCALRITQS